jgi:hypothetical protein
LFEVERTRRVFGEKVPGWWADELLRRDFAVTKGVSVEASARLPDHPVHDWVFRLEYSKTEQLEMINFVSWLLQKKILLSPSKGATAPSKVGAAVGGAL